MNWVSVIVDKAHLFWTPGQLFHRMNVLCGTAHAIILVTATPQYHSPKVHCQLLFVVGHAHMFFQDLSNLARLMKLPSFLGNDSNNKDKEFAKMSKGDQDAARDLSLWVNCALPTIHSGS